MWEESVNINEVKEIRVKTTVFLGVGAIAKMDFIAGELAHKGVKSVLCVTGGGSYKRTGAWDHVQKACAAHDIKITLYDKVTPNPTTDSIDEAAALGRENGATAVICIGGGSPIDAGKSAAVLLANPGKTAEELYTGAFAPDTAAPIVVINLTHGTGSEANRFAVATITRLNYKPAIAFDCIYPWYSIDDPALMASLPAKQTRYVSIDAVNHSIEAATSKATNPFAILLAGECIRLVARWLPAAEENPGDLTARYFLAYAALLAGVSFDNGLLHYTHALEHPLSAVKPELSHGLGLAMIVPAVVELIYPSSAAVLAQILEPIVPGLKGIPAEAHAAASGVEQWLESVNVPEKLADDGFGEGDIPRLVELAQTTPSLGLLLSVAPVEATPERIETIYKVSMTTMK
ncbi:MAG: iron-containing alcohol dehydrogenase [Desulfovibrio sp.]|nr:iron-containing alcohol dehydrogenase [Desulfovibrio sp.]